MKSPWEYAETGTEFAHQVALFQWCSVAAKFGMRPANDPLSYTVRGHALHVMSQQAVGRDVVPELEWLYANKNAVGQNNAIAGARNVAEGVKAGVPDLFLPVPRTYAERHDKGVLYREYHGLYLELKRPKANGKQGVVSDAQFKWINYLRSVGYAAHYCYGWEAARDQILIYLGRSNG